MRIYISSTSLDLKEYRASVIAAILRLGHTPVAMEFYASGPARPVDKCLDDVAGCDAYVGIFAHRYGYIPEGYDRSICELEYRKAVGEGVPALIFLLDESVPWPEDHVDSGQARDRLSRLREELKATNLVSFFKNPDDLCARVTASVALTPVAPHHTGVIGICPADVTTRFRDRVDKVLEVKQLLSEQALKLICIVGRGGIGKTWLLSKVCLEIERGDLRLSKVATRMGADGIIYLDCRSQGACLAEAMFQGLSQLVGRPRSQELRRAWNDVSLSMSDKVKRLLSTLKEGCYLVVLDNFERALADDNTIADSQLRTFVEVCLATPHALRLLATTREEVIVPSAMAAARAVVVDGLPEADAIALMRELDADGELDLRDAPEGQLAEAARRCFCVPRALENVAGILRADRTLTLGQLLAHSSVFTEKVVENLIGEHYRRLGKAEQRVLKALAVLDSPAPLSAIEYLVAPVLSQSEAQAALSHLVNVLFVTRTKVDGDARRSGSRNGDESRGSSQHLYGLHPMDRQFAYAQIPDGLPLGRRVFGRERLTKRRLHRRAARYFRLATRPRESWAERRDLDAPISAFNHLVLAGQYDTAYQTLEQLSFGHLWLWGYCDETVQLYERLPGKLRNPILRGIHRINLAYAYWSTGRLDDAVEMNRRALESLSLKGHPWALARLWGNTGLVCVTVGEIERGKEYFARASRLASVLGDASTQAICLCDRAVACRSAGDIEESMRLTRKGLAQADRAKDSRVLGNLRANLGQCHFLLGDLQAAAESFQAGLDIAREVRSAAGLYYTLRGLAQCALRAEDYETSLSLSREVYGVDFPLGRHRSSFLVGLALGGLNARGESQTALSECIDRCDVLLSLSGRNHDALYCRGAALLGLGRQEEAESSYRAGLRVCPAAGVRREAMLDMQMLAGGAAKREGIRHVASLVGIAVDLEGRLP